MTMLDDGSEEETVEFIKDGHTLTIEWNRDRVWISQVDCPNRGQVALCNRQRAYCVVSRFIEVYGTECNVGRTRVNGPVEVAWVPLLGDSDIDHEFAQIWVIPIDDPDYLALQSAQEEDDDRPG